MSSVAFRWAVVDHADHPRLGMSGHCGRQSQRRQRELRQVVDWLGWQGAERLVFVRGTEGDGVSALCDAVDGCAKDCWTMAARPEFSATRRCSIELEFANECRQPLHAASLLQKIEWLNRTGSAALRIAGGGEIGPDGWTVARALASIDEASRRRILVVGEYGRLRRLQRAVEILAARAFTQSGRASCQVAA